MSAKNTAQVIIGGKIMTLAGYESEEYFQKVAAYMNNKISEFSQLPGYSRQPMETKHMLLSLNITDDYFKAKKQAEVFEQDLQQKDQEMYDLKHELVTLRMQIEDATRRSSDAESERASQESRLKEIENEDAALKSRLGELEDEKASLESRVKELENEKASLEGRTRELEKEVDDLLKK